MHEQIYEMFNGQHHGCMVFARRRIHHCILDDGMPMNKIMKGPMDEVMDARIRTNGVAF